jgi:hypothetical protein
MRWSRVGARLAGDTGPVIAVALLVVVVAAIVIPVGLIAADRT